VRNYTGDGSLKSLVLTLVLAFVVLGCSVAPSMAQGVTTGYTVYVTFFYPIHFLWNLHVTIQDQTGRVVGTGFSSDGSMLIIPVRTERPTNWLSAYALGYASEPLTNWVANPHFWVVEGRSVIPVMSTCALYTAASGACSTDYWITITLSQ